MLYVSCGNESETTCYNLPVFYLRGNAIRVQFQNEMLQISFILILLSSIVLHFFFSEI